MAAAKEEFPNDRPIIGILSHPGDGATGRLDGDPNCSNIPASYIRFVQSGGARVIPLIYNEEPTTFQNKLNMVNGVVLTGGYCFVPPYSEVVETIFEHVIKMKKEGVHFPLLGICLGFEIILVTVFWDKAILEEFDALNLPSTLEIQNPLDTRKTLFERVPSHLLDKLSKDCLVQQTHQKGISPEAFNSNVNLNGFFKILATSTDRKNKVYVSAVQAYEYPIYGVQFHPEKSAYEWARTSKTPHSEAAVDVSHHIISYFVSQARKDSRQVDNSLVLPFLIYNHPPTFCGVRGLGYDEVYIFK